MVSPAPCRDSYWTVRSEDLRTCVRRVNTVRLNVCMYVLSSWTQVTYVDSGFISGSVYPVDSSGETDRNHCRSFDVDAGDSFARNIRLV